MNHFNRFGKFLLCLVVFLSVLVPIVTHAEEVAPKFSVQPVFPKGQVSSNGYFDLNLPPGTKEKLSIVLSNSGDEELSLKISTHSAYTNLNGVVEYGKDAKEYDPSLKNKMSDILKVPSDIILAAGEKKTIELSLAMPKEAFKGILAGGIRIEPSRTDKTSDSSEKGVAVNNTFSYIIGVVLSNNRDIVTPELDLTDVYPDQVNARNVVTAVIQNHDPTFVNQLEIEAKVTKRGDYGIFVETQKSGMQMAPNSSFYFPIYLEGKAFKSGDYDVEITARSKNQEWHWTSSFTVSRETAKRLNNSDVLIKDETNWTLIGFVSITTILLFLVFYLVYRNRQQAKALKKDGE